MAQAKEVYYWVDRSSNFGGGKNAIVYGEEMPADLSKEQEEVYLKAGWISTEKTASARQLSELDQLRTEVKTLRNEKGEGSKLASDNELLLKQVKELEEALEEATKPKAGRPPKDK
jgi:hypothetical protein